MGTQNVTVNGVPLQEYVNQEIGREIGDVRQTEQGVKVRRSIVSKNNRNVSRAKSSRGIVLYQQGQMAQKVIIRGTVFPWAEKGALGFVKAGKSILGGLECTEDETKVKCHECGLWFSSLGGHSRQAHKATAKVYRETFGLSRTSAISSPATSQKFRIAAARNTEFFGGKKLKRLQSALRSFRRTHLETRIRNTPEDANMQMGCMAQLTVRINNLAARLGHCPTRVDLQRGDEFGSISTSVIKWSFNMTVREAFKAIGLSMHPVGPPNRIADKTRLAIIQMRAKGLSYKEISQQMSVSKSTIHKYSTENLASSVNV